MKNLIPCVVVEHDTLWETTQVFVRALNLDTMEDTMGGTSWPLYQDKSERYHINDPFNGTVDNALGVYYS